MASAGNGPSGPSTQNRARNRSASSRAYSRQRSASPSPGANASSSSAASSAARWAYACTSQSAIGARPSVPSWNRIALNESFQPWLASPRPADVDVLDEAVAVGVAVELQPGQRPAQGGQQLGDGRVGQAPPPRVGQQADPQQGGVDRAVVGDRPPVGEPGGRPRRGSSWRSSCMILPGASPESCVHSGALPPGQRAQGALGQLGAQRQHHPRGPDAVAAEQGQEPRRAGAEERARRRAPASVSRRLSRSSRDRVQQPGQPRVVGADLRPGPLDRSGRRDQERAALAHRTDHVSTVCSPGASATSQRSPSAVATVHGTVAAVLGARRPR